MSGSRPYSATMLDHFRAPRNRVALPAPTIAQEGVNPLCGDRVRLELALDGDVVVDAGFTANACAICVASASVLTGLVKRAPLEDVETLTVDDLLTALDTRVSSARLQCVRLPLTVLLTAVQLYRASGQGPTAV